MSKQPAFAKPTPSGGAAFIADPRRLHLTIPGADLEAARAAATARGESLASFVRRAVKTALERPLDPLAPPSPILGVESDGTAP